MLLCTALRPADSVEIASNLPVCPRNETLRDALKRLRTVKSAANGESMTITVRILNATPIVRYSNDTRRAKSASKRRRDLKNFPCTSYVHTYVRAAIVDWSKPPDVGYTSYSVHCTNRNVTRRWLYQFSVSGFYRPWRGRRRAYKLPSRLLTNRCEPDERKTTGHK